MCEPSHHLCACWDRVVLRRRTAKATSERWYHGGTPRSDTASRPGVGILEVFEERRVQFVPVTSPALGLLGQAKFVLPPVSGRAESLGAQ